MEKHQVEKSKETGSTEDNKPEQEDLDSRVLNEMLLNDSKSIPDEAHTEDDNIDKADDNVNETGKDFSKDNTDETSVEDMLKTVQNNSYEQNNDEMADILALLFSSSDNVSKLSNSSDEFFMSVSLTFFVVLSDSSIDIDFNKESRYSSSSVFAISSSDYLLNNLSSSDTS